MLDHHLQRSIVYRLALSPGLRFSELKPAEIENKLFTYHLKKAVAAGYVEKTETGIYNLTPEGRRLGVHALESTQTLMDRAYSVLFLVIRRQKDGAWLLYRRKNHPLRGKAGFMHVVPVAGEPIATTAQRECLDRTGLSGEFRICGSGFFRIFEGQKLESFTNFTLLACEDIQGELQAENELADYFWVDNFDGLKNDLFPNMPSLLEKYYTNELFFLEQTL